jgi:hypothetical protein
MKRLHRSEKKQDWKLSGCALLGGALGDVRVALGELVDPACGIDELLLTREEWMAGGTNADFQVLPRRAGVIRRAARAVDRGFAIIGMNAVFHGLEKGARNLVGPGFSAIKKSGIFRLTFPRDKCQSHLQ